jgi:hypothetical protein
MMVLVKRAGNEKSPLVKAKWLAEVPDDVELTCASALQWCAPAHWRQIAPTLEKDIERRVVDSGPDVGNEGVDTTDDPRRLLVSTVKYNKCTNSIRTFGPKRIRSDQSVSAERVLRCRR